jgi:hypothetical protein
VGYGIGGAAADYDDDGDLDLYITTASVNELWQNQGDGSFSNVAVAAGVGGELWSSGAAFADFDRDGDLDLYVSNYVDWALDNNKFCGDAELGIQGYCTPQKYNGLPDNYYRNLGDGTFVECAAEVGLGEATNAGLGVVVGDVDNDGWPDLFIANDSHSNFLFRNLGDGTFEDLSLLSGTAYGQTGRPEAGMGVDMGDVDNDGLLDIVVTNFELETNVLYKNLGGALFIDVRFAHNVAETSLLKLAFGVDLVDLDSDGDEDLVLSNGHILDNAAELGVPGSYGQANQVLENLGDGRFRLVSAPGFSEELASRGLASGDLDGDGDMDLAILNSDAAAAIYENLGADGSTELLVDLVGSSANRSGVGVRVTVSDGARKQLKEVRTSSSYVSQSALTLHFGLGRSTDAAVVVDVAWPSGNRQKYTAPVNSRLRLIESEPGDGKSGKGTIRR